MDKRKQNEIKKYFDGLYKSGVTPWKNHLREPQLDRFLETLKKTNPGAKILDIGCGDGWISIKAAKKSFEVWGIDGSETAIDRARELSSSAGVQHKTHFQPGDALNLPYENNFFHAVIDRGLFHHILPANRGLYLENILRVVKKKSFLYLSVFSKNNPEGIGQRFDEKDIVDFFGANFQVADFKSDPYPTPAPAHLYHFIMERI